MRAQATTRYAIEWETDQVLANERTADDVGDEGSWTREEVEREKMQRKRMHDASEKMRWKRTARHHFTSHPPVSRLVRAF